MTNKALVQAFYPKAYTYRVWNKIVNINRGDNGGRPIGAGKTAKEAWANAVAKLRGKSPLKPKKAAKKVTSVAEAKKIVEAGLRKAKKNAKRINWDGALVAMSKPKNVRQLSNTELNSGWKTTVIDHGAADSMAGWPAYRHDELPAF